LYPVNATNILQTTDVHCSPPGDCIWSNGTGSYYRHVAQNKFRA